MSRLALTLVTLASLSSIAFAEMAPARRMRVPQPPPDRAAVRAKLVANRNHNLAAFRAYEKAGVFPSNVYLQSELNVWRDEDFHFCAAATIIRASGKIGLVDAVAEQNNFIELADVQQGPLMDWILTSGFTQEELVLVQRPFRPVTKPVTMPAVAPDLKTAETARLKKLYKQIEAKLVANRKRSIETALDVLMKNPAAARALLAASPPPPLAS